MSASVIAAVLCAALMHAGWNVLLKRHAGQRAGGVPAMAIVAGSGLLCAAGLPFVAAPDPASWPFIAASALAQTVYYRLLAATYRDGGAGRAAGLACCWAALRCRRLRPPAPVRLRHSC